MRSYRKTWRARHLRVLLAMLLLAPAFAVGGCDREPIGSLELTGSVVDETLTLPAPLIVPPAPDLEVGFAPSVAGTAGVSAALEGGAAGGSSGRTSSSASSWIRVGSVEVRAGDQVMAGETLATFDTALLSAALSSARADSKAASATVGYVDSLLGDVSEGKSDIASKTAEINKTITDLQTQRTDVMTKLAAARTAAASTPATATPAPGTIPPAELVKQLEAALKKLDDGIKAAQDGLLELQTASTDLDTASAALQAAKRAVDALAEARDVIVEIAQAELDRAIVTAPVAGRVLSVTPAGEVIAGGAPAIVLRPDSPTEIETYVTAEERALIEKGTQAVVHADSSPGEAFVGHITAIGTEYEFVPTRFATRAIHLTRGFRVVVELNGSDWVVPGTPVDISLAVQ